MYKELDKVIVDHLLEGNYSRNTKSDAGALLYSIQQFPFISLSNFWYPILKSVEKVSKHLQDPKMGFKETFCDLKSLKNKYFEKWNIPIARPRRKRMMAGEIARDSGLTAQQKINAVMVEIVNRLKTEI